MATDLSSPGVELIRTIEFCPYHTNCRYNESCRYLETAGHAIAGRLRNTGEILTHVGQGMLGAVCLLTGIMLSMTFFLILIGVPLALLGVAFLMTAGESTRRL